MKALLTTILIAAVSPLPQTLPNCQKQGWAIFIPGNQTILPNARACQRDFPDNPGRIIRGYQLNFKDGEEAKTRFRVIQELHPGSKIIYDSAHREG